MKRFQIKIYVLIIAATFSFSFSALAEKRVALVIGNGAYDSGGSLANPPNDAKLISGTLRSVGFDVIERINVDQKSMKIAIKAFRRKLAAAGKDAVGLFYYAGHGVQVGTANYLIPVNASIENESDVDIEAVTANTVLRSMEFAGNRLNIVIMDACRNNPYKRGFRSGVQGLARMDATSGMLIAYATAPGDVAADGKGRNSPYTAALAAGMRRPGLSVEQMFKRVRVSVQHRTKNAQTPWESSSLTGDFYFVRGSKGSADRPSATTAEADDTQEEIAYWQSLQESRNPKDFLAYINRYGENGAFFILARNRAKALLADKVDGAAPARQPSPDGKSDQELAAEALLRGRKMMAELFSNANHVMGLEGISMGERIEKFRGLLGGVGRLPDNGEVRRRQALRNRDPRRMGAFLCDLQGAVFCPATNSRRAGIGQGTSR